MKQESESHNERNKVGKANTLSQIVVHACTESSLIFSYLETYVTKNLVLLKAADCRVKFS
jgi:hypothetical protein